MNDCTSCRARLEALERQARALDRRMREINANHAQFIQALSSAANWQRELNNAVQMISEVVFAKVADKPHKKESTH
jgi:hypothetical protein